MRSVISPPFPRPRENEAEIARPKSAENDRPIRPLNSSGPKNDRDDLVGSWEKKSTSPCCPSLHRRFFATLSWLENELCAERKSESWARKQETEICPVLSLRLRTHELLPTCGLSGARTILIRFECRPFFE